MLDQVLDIFDIEPDYNLNFMKIGEDLYYVTTNTLHIFNLKIVLMHANTTTTSVTSLYAFYQKIKVGYGNVSKAHRPYCEGKAYQRIVEF